MDKPEITDEEVQIGDKHTDEDENEVVHKGKRGREGRMRGSSKLPPKFGVNSEEVVEPEVLQGTYIPGSRGSSGG